MFSCFRPELLNQIRFDLETLPGFQALFRNFGAAGNPTAISPFLFLPEAEITDVMMLLENCRRELERQEPGFQSAAVASFLHALTGICRKARLQGGRGEENSFRISRVVEQLNSRYSEEFSVPRMAKLAGMSVSNFRHRFSEVMGVSPVEYLTRLRQKMAAGAGQPPLQPPGAAECLKTLENTALRRSRGAPPAKRNAPLNLFSRSAGACSVRLRRAVSSGRRRRAAPPSPRP